MRKFRALFWVSFRGLTYSLGFGGRKSGKRAGGGPAVLALMLALCAFMSATYSFPLAPVLVRAGQAPLLFALLGIMTVALCAIFTAIGAREVVFGTKDIDIVLALPVSPFSLILARLAALYVENLVLTLAWLAPTGAAYMMQTGFSVGVSLRLALAAILLALLPLFIALAVGFVLAFISGRFTRHALVENILYFALLLLVVGGSLWGSFSGLGDPGAQAVQFSFSGGLAPLQWFADFVAAGGALSLVKLGLVCVVPVALLAALCSRSYNGVLASLQNHGGRSDYKLGRMQGGSVFRALLKKEKARYVNTSIYLFNTIVGLLMLLAAGIAAVIKGRDLAGFLAASGLEGVPVLPLAAGAMGFCLALTAITASSVSLEGNTLWVLQSLPVPAGQVLRAKSAFHQLLAAPFTVASGLMLGLGLGAGVLNAAGLAVGGLLMNWAAASAGLLINLAFPKLDAVNDTVVVKQSAAASFSMLAGVGLAAAAGVAWRLASLAWPRAGLAAALALLAVCGCALEAALQKKGPDMFRALTD
ncbi:hypothetical protein [Allofournierella sp.]|uniref:hypothetical protein n=1 Tax=Allofournierella sp. TaxID=1940256 RepID=UPI003AB1173E